MIVKQELLRRIRDNFDLNIYETKVWLALLSKGIATAGEVAEISNVPRSRTYDVLKSLERQGFAIEKIGKPVKYVALKPATVLEKLKGDFLKEAKEKVDTLAKLKETDDYQQIELLYKEGVEPTKAEEISGTFRGKHNIYSQLREMMSKASKNVILATDLDALKEKIKILRPVLENLKRKGIKVKIIANGTAEEIKEIAKEIKVDIRKTDLDARFCIVDNNELMFMITPSNHESDTGVWIKSEYFASALSDLFNLAWNECK